MTPGLAGRVIIELTIEISRHFAKYDHLLERALAPHQETDKGDCRLYEELEQYSATHGR